MPNANAKCKEKELAMTRKNFQSPHRLKSLFEQGVLPMPKLALIRGFGGEPMRRIIAGQRNGVVFVCSERAAANNEGLPPPIGVPLQDAFAYSEISFERLRDKWTRGAKIESKDWGLGISD
jgi:hypothetical protein